MATRTVVQYTDDYDGEPAEDAETIHFAYDGAEYEIDLRPENAAKLATALAPYIDRARRKGRMQLVKPSRQSGGGPARTDSEQLKAIRDWANANGYAVSARGRVPANVQEAYNAAGGAPLAAAS